MWARASSLGESWRSGNLEPSIDRVTREKERIRTLRSELRERPKQPLMWSELARSQMIIGRDEDASRSMACAIHLAPENVYLRRCASRMHLHLDDHDSALSVIRKHPAAKHDPRLVSAEIAVSSVAKRPSKCAHLARGLVDEERYRAQHRSEVAAAIGTVELESGRHRKARDLFQKSLESPSENTLAQVQWASERDSKIIIPSAAWETPCSHEAEAMASRARHDWNSVLDCCELWLDSEPFASKPAHLGSFASFRTDFAERAHRIATNGLLVNKENTLLLNNRAVSSAYLGRIDEAIIDIKNAIKAGAASDAHMAATMGLIAYRSGLPDLGEQYYGTAVAKFLADKNVDSILLASLYWIREMARYDPGRARLDFDYVKKTSYKLLGGRRDPEVESMLEVIEAEIGQEVLVSVPFMSDNRGEISSVFDSFSIGRNVVAIRSRLLEEMLKN